MSKKKAERSYCLQCGAFERVEYLNEDHLCESCALQIPLPIEQEEL